MLDLICRVSYFFAGNVKHVEEFVREAKFAAQQPPACHCLLTSHSKLIAVELSAIRMHVHLRSAVDVAKNCTGTSWGGGGGSVVSRVSGATR